MAFLEGELAALVVLHRLWVGGRPAGRGSAIPSLPEGPEGRSDGAGRVWWGSVVLS